MPYVLLDDDKAVAPKGYVLLPDEPAAVSAGRAINSIPRQLGLTARYALEGPAQAAQIVTEPVRNLLLNPAIRAFGGKGIPALGEATSDLLDRAGLPRPETANERVVGDAARLVAGAGATMGAGGLARGAEGAVGQLGTMLSTAPAQQLSSAAGAGLAAGASREAGGGTATQIGAGVLGGLAGGMAPSAVNGLADTVRRMRTAGTTPQQFDAQISALLETQGVDYAQVPERLRQGLRAELSGALRTGREVNPEAVRRLLDFQRVGATPTRGMLSQDPVQITREQNLAKIAANSGDNQLHPLPRMQNENNTRLIEFLNEQGAGRTDMFTAGQRAIGGIEARNAAATARTRELYGVARDAAGREVPLNRRAFVDSAFENLARDNKTAFLPENIGTMLNQISLGKVTSGGREFDVPFDVNTIDNLKTMLATASRGSQDGNQRAAIAAVRRALDNADILPVKRQFGGGQVLPPGMGPAVQAADAAPAEALNAFDRARRHSRAQFAWQESSRPVAAALDGAQPDKFIQSFVVNGSLQDAQAVARNTDRQAVREAIVSHLKEKALGQGAADEVGKFSQSGYNKALNQIGDRKLALFFAPEELEAMRAAGRVASYMQVQPVGSAVNNSNSGATLLGRQLDLARTVLPRTPVLGPMVVSPLQGLNISLSQRAAQNAQPGLLVPQPAANPLAALLAPSVGFGGLLAAPGSP